MCRGLRLKTGEPWRMKCSATSRLMTPPAPSMRVLVSPLAPKMPFPRPWVKTWVPAPRASAQAPVNHDAENATANPQTTRTLPPRRGQSGKRRRRPGENWNAPGTAQLMALAVCTTTGAGDAVKRGFAGIKGGPPDSSSSRSEPATAGIRTRAMSANGTHRPVPSLRGSSFMPIWARPGQARHWRFWPPTRRSGCGATVSSRVRSSPGRSGGRTAFH